MIRHWKQTYDPRRDAGAPLVWLRSLVFAGVQVSPGEPVTDEQRKQLGPNRIRLWWDRGYIGRTDQKAAPVVAKIPHRQIDAVEFGEPCLDEDALILTQD